MYVQASRSHWRWHSHLHHCTQTLHWTVTLQRTRSHQDPGQTFRFLLDHNCYIYSWYTYNERPTVHRRQHTVRSTDKHVQYVQDNFINRKKKDNPVIPRTRVERSRHPAAKASFFIFKKALIDTFVEQLKIFSLMKGSLLVRRASNEDTMLPHSGQKE